MSTHAETPRTDRERAEQIAEYYSLLRTTTIATCIETALAAVRAEARQEERQRCAKIARHADYHNYGTCGRIAAAIEAEDSHDSLP